MVMILGCFAATLDALQTRCRQNLASGNRLANRPSSTHLFAVDKFVRLAVSQTISVIFVQRSPGFGVSLASLSCSRISGIPATTANAPARPTFGLVAAFEAVTFWKINQGLVKPTLSTRFVLHGRIVYVAHTT